MNNDHLIKLTEIVKLFRGALTEEQLELLEQMLDGGHALDVTDLIREMRKGEE